MVLKKSRTPVRLAVIGPFGRMGQLVIKEALQDPSLNLRARVSREFRKDFPEVILTHQIESVIEEIDLLIDFSSPDAISEYMPIVKKYPTAVVIGTTDLQQKHYNLLQEAAYASPIMHAPNFSFGIFLLRELLQTIVNYSPKCHIGISETHHKEKRDRPSGTAKVLSSQLKSIQESIVIRSFRRKSTVGIHKVTIHLGDEDIIISHSAKNRLIFASSSIRVGKWLITQPPGKYTIEDYFSCNQKSFISA